MPKRKKIDITKLQRNIFYTIYYLYDAVKRIKYKKNERRRHQLCGDKILTQ